MCKEKNDALVEITLPKDANIYASEYKLYLPDKKVLQNKLKEWIDEEYDNKGRMDAIEAELKRVVSADALDMEKLAGVKALVELFEAVRE